MEKGVPVMVEIYEIMFECFQERYEELVGEKYDTNLKSTAFQRSGEDFGKKLKEKIKDIYTCHIKYIWDRIIKPARSGNLGKDNQILWRDELKTNQQLLELIDPNSDGRIKKFVLNNQSKILPEVFKSQMKKITVYEDYGRKKLSGAKNIAESFYLYISLKEGLKTGFLNKYNNNTWEIVLEDNTRYLQATEVNTEVAQIINFNKQIGQKRTRLIEVTFYFFTCENQKKLIFQEGVFSAIDTNNQDRYRPSLVVGAVIAERISAESRSRLVSIPMKKIEEIDPVVISKVANKRMEIKNLRNSYSTVSNFIEQYTKELRDIRDPNFSSIEEFIGHFAVIIYSPTNNGMRKIILNIEHDLTITAKAVKAQESNSIIQYKGAILSNRRDLLMFSIFNIEDPVQHMSFIFKSLNFNRLMHGVCSGVFKSKPKNTLALLIKKTAKNGNTIDFDNPKIIPLDRPPTPSDTALCTTPIDNFEIIEQLYENGISKFFLGEDKGYMNSTSENKTEPLKLFVNKQEGKFLHISGSYEQYYFNSYTGRFRKDFIQILPSGKIQMMGKYPYEGEVKLSQDNLSINLNPKFKDRWLMPVNGLYKIRFGEKDEGKVSIIKGIFCDFLDGNKDIVACEDVWIMVSGNIIDEASFFKQECSDFAPYGSTWDQLPDSTLKILTDMTGGELM